MASPPDCPVCNTKNVAEKSRYHDANARDVAVVMLTCGHGVILTNGQWQRVSTASSSATTTDTTNFESAGGAKITISMISSLLSLFKKNR